MKDDYLKKILDRLSVCLTYAGEDIEGFLWVLDEDERDGYAPADVERLRGIYRQIKDQYAQDGRDLRLGMSTEDCLDLAVHENRRVGFTRDRVDSIDIPHECISVPIRHGTFRDGSRIQLVISV